MGWEEPPLTTTTTMRRRWRSGLLCLLASTAAPRATQAFSVRECPGRRSVVASSSSRCAAAASASTRRFDRRTTGRVSAALLRTHVRQSSLLSPAATTAFGEALEQHSTELFDDRRGSRRRGPMRRARELLGRAKDWRRRRAMGSSSRGLLRRRQQGATSRDEGPKNRAKVLHWTKTVLPKLALALAILGAANPSLCRASDALVAGDGAKFIPGFGSGAASIVQELLAPGARRDSLTLLLATATVIPLAKSFGLSPILGFLASGVALGPNGFGVVTELSTTEALAELGVVFFLFEMGLELSLAKLGAMKKEIFGLGLAQFLATTAVLGAAVCGVTAGAVGAKAGLIVGGALALSSSAFVLQLLRDQDELGTTHGRAALGVLLLQDLAVVPLLVLTPLLASEAPPLKFAAALSAAVVKAVAAVLMVEFVFKRILDSAFDRAARSRSQEAFLSVALLACLGVSAFTESIGLSDTLGAFLAGIALSETRYSYKVEADVAPFRGMLLGLFFVTVGFSMDVAQICASPLTVLGFAAALLGVKAGVLGALGLLFRLPVAAAVRSGLLLAQGGEFGFVAFGLAERLGLLDPTIAKFLVTAVAVSMAATPLCASLGNRLAKAWTERKQREEDHAKNTEEQQRVSSSFEQQQHQQQRALVETAAGSSSPRDSQQQNSNLDARDAARALFLEEEEEEEHKESRGVPAQTTPQPATPKKAAQPAGGGSSIPDVVVCGYGQLGKVVCEMLDAKLHRYVVVEKDATKAARARADGRPVFFGDLTSAETLDAFNVANARLVVIATSGDVKATNSVVVALRRLAREKKNAAALKEEKDDVKPPTIVARAVDAKHRRSLKGLGVKAYLPSLEDDSRLLTLPFAGAVLRKLGFREEEVDMLIEESRQCALGFFDEGTKVAMAAAGGAAAAAKAEQKKALIKAQTGEPAAAGTPGGPAFTPAQADLQPQDKAADDRAQARGDVLFAAAAAAAAAEELLPETADKGRDPEECAPLMTIIEDNDDDDNNKAKDVGPAQRGQNETASLLAEPAADAEEDKVAA